MIVAFLVLFAGAITNPIEAPEIRSFAVYKVSYNSPVDAVGGIAGTAFFVSNTRAITAYHVLNPATLKPNPGFRRVRLWLLHESHRPIEISSASVTFLPDRDQSLIRIGQPVQPAWVYSVSAPNGLETYSEGYHVGSGRVQFQVTGGELEIVRVESLPYSIVRGRILKFEKVSVTAPDIQLESVAALRMNSALKVGMSGGPTLQGGKVIAFNSFGLPADSIEKEVSWAIPISPQNTKP